MIAKAGLGLIGLGALSVGSVALAKPGLLGMMPHYTTLSQDHDYSSKEGNEYNNKFGKTYKDQLVGVVGNSNAENTKSSVEDWWEWSFERLKKDKPDSKKFKHKGGDDDAIKNKYSDTDTNGDSKALNQVCKAAYQVDKSKVTAAGSNNDEYKEADVWKYCSFLGEKPKTISEVQRDINRYGTGNAIGKDSTYTSKLVSTKGNDKFWEIRDKEFKKEDGYGNIEGTNDAFFKNEQGTTTTIRDLCEKAYNIEAGDEASTATKPKKDQVVKYCSLSKE